MPALATRSAFSFVKFRLRGQLAVPKQPDDFFERGVFGQRMDVIAAIAEDARVAIDVTNL